MQLAQVARQALEHLHRRGGQQVLGADFHRKVRDLYHTLAKEEPGRFFVVDAARPPEAVEEEIWHEIARRFR